MKFLCICYGGNVRSVALAQVIKEAGHEAIAVGDKYISKDTIALLTTWADQTIDLRAYLPKDVWLSPRHPDLIKQVGEIWKSVARRL